VCNLVAKVLPLTRFRWLFLLEGLITLVVGLASFFFMPASAVQTKTWFRPNGWFTDRETAIVVNRVLRDDPSKGDMHNRQAITPRRLWHALQDYDLWPVSKTIKLCEDCSDFYSCTSWDSSSSSRCHRRQRISHSLSKLSGSVPYVFNPPPKIYLVINGFSSTLPSSRFLPPYFTL